MAKPNVKLRSLRLLAEIDAYIKQYDIRGRWLPSAAGDVLDGAVFNHEIRDLINRKLLTVCVDCPPRENGDECGDSWTVRLTPRAILAFWPTRV